MLSYSITICTFNQHSHFSFLTSKNEPFFHLPARFFLGSQEVGVVEEIWNKTLGLGDLPRRARSERCFWAAKSPTENQGIAPSALEVPG